MSPRVTVTVPATDSMSDCSVTGCGLIVVEPVLERLTEGESPGPPPRDRAVTGESVILDLLRMSEN